METKSKALKIVSYVVATVLGLVFLFPIYYTFINSIRGLNSLPAIFTPTAFEWVNFKYVFTLIPYGKYLVNSLIILAITVPIGLVVNVLYGYALAKLQARGQSLIFYGVLITMMIPTFAIQIPQYILFSKVGLTDTFLLWVFEATAGNAGMIFLARQYFYSMPRSLVEAAYIDGCTPFTAFTQIILPLSKPLCAIIVFQIFLFNWGDYMTSYMYLSKDKYPLVMSMFTSAEYVMPGTNVVLTPVVNAASLIFMIPVLILFFICQKHLVEGATASGIKG